MNRIQYLRDDVAGFRDWMASCLLGESINFSVAGCSTKYQTLSAALAAYRWPLKKVVGLPTPHNGYSYIHPVVPDLPAMSSLAANTVVLDAIRSKLRTSYKSGSSSNDLLSGAVASVFHWGGVYRKIKNGGNKPWLESNHPNLLSILQAVVVDYAAGDDCSKVSNLRFNSGMTKVYSLLIDDFVIYDSRVAAALAWMTLRWWTREERQPPSTLPLDLRFGCLAGNGRAMNRRNPERLLFKTLSNSPYNHYRWNVRTNWLLDSALSMAGKQRNFGSLREVEAALFQLGERVI